VAKKLESRAKVAKLNVDEASDTAGRYGIRAIPTLIIFKDGATVQQFVGVQQESELISAIKRAF
jgi:thioredoxin 1